jgi:outer membrane protein OmpA-like peptidoglycan-associated protein
MVRRSQRAEDATVWIGYADFLTTLAVLFLVLVVGIGAKYAAKSSAFEGVALDVGTRTPLRGCSAQLGADRRTLSDDSGEFRFRIDSLRGAAAVGIILQCEGYDIQNGLVLLVPDQTKRDTFLLSTRTVVSVATLPGDALFKSNEYALKRGAVETLVRLGNQLKGMLASDEILAVQGHTDDVPYPAGSDKDNWMLSGERAAAAAKVLTDPQYGVAIPACQVSIMGFGPSRPAEALLPIDDRSELDRKRSRNRRIEFRRLKGTDISGARCVR